MVEMSKAEKPNIKFKRKIVGNTGVTRITIPKEIIDALEIQLGEYWEIYAEDNETIIMKRIKE